MTTRRNINLWQSINEEKWRHIPIETELKVPVIHGGKFMGIHKPSLMDRGEGKSGKKSCIFKDVERQQENSGKRKGIEENGGVISPVSMTRSEKILKEGVGNHPNTSKTIEKQDLEGGGFTTCTQKCKTSNIGK